MCGAPAQVIQPSGFGIPCYTGSYLIYFPPLQYYAALGTTTYIPFIRRKHRCRWFRVARLPAVPILCQDRKTGAHNPAYGHVKISNKLGSIQNSINPLHHLFENMKDTIIISFVVTYPVVTYLAYLYGRGYRLEWNLRWTRTQKLVEVYTQNPRIQLLQHLLGLPLGTYHIHCCQPIARSHAAHIILVRNSVHFSTGLTPGPYFGDACMEFYLPERKESSLISGTTCWQEDSNFHSLFEARAHQTRRSRGTSRLLPYACCGGLWSFDVPLEPGTSDRASCNSQVIHRDIPVVINMSRACLPHCD